MVPPLPPPPPPTKVETTKFTTGKIWLGHFWYTYFWGPDLILPSGEGGCMTGPRYQLAVCEAQFHDIPENPRPLAQGPSSLSE